jgi:SAM-dependent methyltransferase
MQHSYKILYFDLLPPPPFFREANKILASSSILFILLSVAWSLNLFKGDPERGIVGDTLILGSALSAFWYLSLLISSAWRLKHYESGSGLLPSSSILLFPWAALVVLNCTVLIASSLDHVNQEFGSRRWLWTALVALLSPLLAFEIPVLKNWLPKFDLRTFPIVFRKSLPILLGRESGTSVDLHAKHVVEFQVEFINFMNSDKNGSISNPLPPYYDSAQQKPFQDTLSCIYSTSSLIGKRLSQTFSGQLWSLLDIGCGEGRFTAGLLAEIDNVPAAVTAIDPAPGNVSTYRCLLRSKFSNIFDVDTTIGKVEDWLNDLPSANLVLASHSLYAVLDHNRKKSADIVEALIKKAENGLAIFIMASKDSYLYTVKRIVLGELRRPDRSSFGEDLIELIPSNVNKKVEYLDTYVDVTSILADREKLLSWMAYFCRLDAGELDSQYDFCQGILRNAAIEVRCLPESEKSRIKGGPNRAMRLSDESYVIYHREVLITIPTSNAAQ